MLKAINKRIRNKKGFTLVELIVVLAVLGILAAITVPRLTGVQEDAKWKADIASAANLGKAGEMYVQMNPDVIPNDDDNPEDITEDLKDDNYIDEEDLKVQYLNDTDAQFVIKVDSDGKVSVHYNNDEETELYPIDDGSNPSKPPQDEVLSQ